jgi:hypothetical protein
MIVKVDWVKTWVISTYDPGIHLESLEKITNDLSQAQVDVFSVVTRGSFGAGYQHFTGHCCLHLHYTATQTGNLHRHKQLVFHSVASVTLWLT